MLYNFPFRYEDRRKIFTVAEINSVESSVQIIGVILKITEEGQGKGKRLKALLKDKTGTMELVWFRGVKWVKESLKLKTIYLVQGKPQEFRGFYSIVHPELTKYDEAAIKKQLRIRPVYALTEPLKKQGVDNKLLHKLSHQIILNQEFGVSEYLPAYVLQEHGLVNMKDAIKWIHAPESNEQISKAIRRLKFNELLDLQYKIIQHKSERQEKLEGYAFDKIGKLFNSFYQDQLEFDLTNAQKRVIKEVRIDVQNGAQMNRLVQGDVGSGKNYSSLVCNANGN